MGLIERIHKYLNEVLCIEYTGKLQFEVDYNFGDAPDLADYYLEWPLNPDDYRNPMILMGQFRSEDEFYDYIIKEIKAKRFYLYKNFRAIKLPINDKP